ncbi:hypothetical protein [Aneurinibacillus aneurinilyticus]|uniref:hypothetical protein n=1 Tax=Aneurinibacillus aneurinilyticus TaxID=1391 RepID=UPI001F0E3756|nr:hypothetical protein [Aneurinibacillus aneurinilyticus]MCI1693643.1 hypothetical protein [Aneurinibacillus aneurinilyticus]
MIVESMPVEEELGLESCWNTRILQYLIEDKFAVTMSRTGSDFSVSICRRTRPI